ncbi:MAG: hypothetical protein ABWZ76_12075 [Acidimicrobiales bacterium]
MFNDYTTTTALVADRHERLHHDAQQHRVARRILASRRGRGAGPAAAPAPVAITTVAPRSPRTERGGQAAA